MSYTANVTREGNDWLAEVRDLPGAHAFARTLAALRRELADAIILSADLPDGSPVGIDLVLDDPQLAGLQAAVDLSVERHRAAEVAASLTARTEEAARRLVGAGWSVRDVVGALDVTAGPVSQLTRERRPSIGGRALIPENVIALGRTRSPQRTTVLSALCSTGADRVRPTVD